MRLPAHPVPDQEATADFRRDAGEVIRSICAGCTVLYRGLGTVTRDHTAINGSGFVAVDNPGCNPATGQVRWLS